jgi:hypothetical protein
MKCDCGNQTVRKSRPSQVGVATVIAMTLLLSWPLVGAGDGGGGTRGALRLAWRAEGKATFVVEPA